jgi:hypothetical protein
MPARSVRVADEPWDRARRRANYEGVTMSNMVAQLVDGYGKGLIDLPKVQISYTPTRTEVKAP